MENTLAVPQKKLNIELLEDPKTLLIEFYVSKRIKNICPYEILYTIFITLFVITKKCPSTHKYHMT